MNLLKAILSFIRKATDLECVPLDVSIEPVNSCNFKCSFCPQSNTEHFRNVIPNFLTEEKLSVMLNKLRGAKVKTRTLHWTLDGEPFMNPQMLALCEVASRYGFDHQFFSSNGFLLSREIAEAMRNKRNIQFHIFIDFCSDLELFERYRGFQGTWEVVKKNINEVGSLVNRSNIRLSIMDISKIAVKDEKDLRDRIRQLRQLFHFLKRKEVYFRDFHDWCGEISLPGESRERQKETYHLCPYPWFSCNLASNGDWVGCCRDLEHKMVVGNLLEQDFWDIWNGEKFQSIRKNLVEKKASNNSLCSQCDMPYDQSRFKRRNFLRSIQKRFNLFR